MKKKRWFLVCFGIYRKSSGKPNKIWVDKGSKSYFRLKDKILREIVTSTCWAGNEGKSVIAEDPWRMIVKVYGDNAKKCFSLIN